MEHSRYVSLESYPRFLNLIVKPTELGALFALKVDEIYNFYRSEFSLESIVTLRRDWIPGTGIKHCPSVFGVELHEETHKFSFNICVTEMAFVIK